MKKLCLWSLILLCTSSWAGDVLFVDFNNADKEIEACAKGIAEQSKKDGTQDDLFVLTGATHADALDKYLTEHSDRKFDTIVFSGEDGNEKFFGENGTLTFRAIKEVMARHKEQDELKLTVHWGCYTANAAACNEQGLANVAPTVQNTLGYTVQAPTKDVKENWPMLTRACRDRKQMMTSSPDYCAMLKTLDPSNVFGLSICYGSGVASYEYGERDEKGRVKPGQYCMHSREELNRRCDEFDPGEDKRKMFDGYMNAEPGYEDIPKDHWDQLSEEERKARASEGCGGKSALRCYYSQLHLWRHCREQFAKDHGYELPFPPTVLRLIKFPEIVSSLLGRHADDIQQYNEKLRQAGMGEFALENIKGARRKDVIDRTFGAVMKLRGLLAKGRYSKNGVNLENLLLMARGFDLTLRQLKQKCSDQSWVHGDGYYKSHCIAPYGKVPGWPPNKPKI